MAMRRSELAAIPKGWVNAEIVLEQGFVVVAHGWEPTPVESTSSAGTTHAPGAGYRGERVVLLLPLIAYGILREGVI
jgi:hypothetical protein